MGTIDIIWIISNDHSTRKPVACEYRNSSIINSDGGFGFNFCTRKPTQQGVINRFLQLVMQAIMLVMKMGKPLSNRFINRARGQTGQQNKTVGRWIMDIVSRKSCIVARCKIWIQLQEWGLNKFRTMETEPMKQQMKREWNYKCSW